MPARAFLSGPRPLNRRSFIRGPRRGAFSRLHVPRSRMDMSDHASIQMRTPACDKAGGSHPG